MEIVGDTSSHLRSIGDRAYKSNQKMVDGEVWEVTIETTLAENEIADFKLDWNLGTFSSRNFSMYS